MAEEEKEQEGTEKSKKKEKGKLGLPAILAIVVVVLLFQAGLIFAIFKFFVAPPATHQASESGSPAKKEKTEQTAEEPQIEDEEAEDDDVIVRKVGKLIPVGEEDIVVNARSRSPEPRYVVLRVVLEIDPDSELEEQKLEEILIPVKDEIIQVVRSHWIEEFLEPGFEEVLKKEIKKQIQPYFGEVRVRKVRFTKFIIQ